MGRVAGGAIVLVWAGLLSACHLDKLLSGTSPPGQLVVAPGRLIDSARVGSVRPVAESVLVSSTGSGVLHSVARTSGSVGGVYRDSVVITGDDAASTAA